MGAAVAGRNDLIEPEVLQPYLRAVLDRVDSRAVLLWARATRTRREIQPQLEVIRGVIQGGQPMVEKSQEEAVTEYWLNRSGARIMVWTVQITFRMGLIGLFWLGVVLVASARADVRPLLEAPDDWFTSEEGRRVLDNVLGRQQPSGGWWKNYDPHEPVPSGDAPHDGRSTFDNHATTTELRLLARAFTVTQRPAYRKAFDRALAMILDAQYDNGGWPQQFPLPDGYGRHITFNDGVMVHVLELLRDVAGAEADFAFVSREQRDRSSAAFERGIECILDTQVRIGGKRAVWCQQHDAQTLEPASARSYELPSLSGAESAEIILLLMDLPDPQPRVIEAIQSAAGWFEESRLTGIRLGRVEHAGTDAGYDLQVVDDPSAQPLWARFYDLETGRPFFCGRDGEKKWSLAEIEHERRVGYAWYGTWGRQVLERYPGWARRHGLPPELP